MKNKGNIEKIRRAVAAGQYYPSDEKDLSIVIDDYLEQATVNNPAASFRQAPQVLIAPHAGYVYSGRVAAFGFRALLGGNFERAVIIGRSHQAYFNGVAVDSNDVWQTPLGDVAIDKDFIAKLRNSSSMVKINSQPHQGEHSLEVILPFLQKVLVNNFKIVPLLFGDDEFTNAQWLGEALAKIIDDKTAVVISSDLSHYPEHKAANDLDRETIKAILTGDPAAFQLRAASLPNLKQSSEVVTLACAESAIMAGMVLAQKLALKPRLLKYANSGDYFSETRDRAVGYAAIAFFRAEGRSEPPPSEGRSSFLSQNEQRAALQIARKILAGAFDEKDYHLPSDLPKIFQEKRGVFVTLKKQGGLRGCIGNFTPDIGLAQNIQEMAEAAAFSDPRFTPLTENELKDIEIEISVLSPMRKIANPGIIEVGKHGVYVKKGSRSGVYLPQVATEMGWSKEQFLNSLCEEKAGLPKDCWKDGAANLYIFTAQVFGEQRQIMLFC